MGRHLDELLRDRMVGFLEGIGLDVTYQRFSTDNLMLRCPFAKVGGHSNEIDKNPSFGIQITTAGIRYNCFTCHRKGRSLIQLVEELQEANLIDTGMSPYELQNSIKIEFPGFYDEVDMNTKKQKAISLADYSTNHPEFLTYNVKKRRIDKNLIEIFRLRYDVKTERVIFPCYNKENGLIGLVKHYINGKLPKYKNDFNAGNSLYGEWLIHGKVIIVVEGMYDVITIYKHLRDLKLLGTFSVVGMYGAEVTFEQCNMLVKHANAVILMGDNDFAGITMERDIYRMTNKKLPLVYRARYEGHDPDKLTKEKFNDALNNRVLFGVYEQMKVKY